MVSGFARPGLTRSTQKSHEKSNADTATDTDRDEHRVRVVAGLKGEDRASLEPTSAENADFGSHSRPPLSAPLPSSTARSLSTASLHNDNVHDDTKESIKQR